MILGLTDGQQIDIMKNGKNMPEALKNAGVTPEMVQSYFATGGASNTTGFHIDNLSGTTGGGAAATAFALTGPTAGPAGAASSNFTVTPNGATTGTFTPNAQSGCTYAPATLTLTGESVRTNAGRSYMAAV